MLYTIKITGTSQVSKEISPNNERQHIVKNFAVKELNYSDSIMLRKDGFTEIKARAKINEKIKDYLKGLTEQEEYKEEIR